jgi:hypothetical protein
MVQPGLYPAHYAQSPAAPHSLAPVAMSSLDAGATGPQAAQSDADSATDRSRPSLKTGFVILLAGALIGGLAGVGVRARENAAAASQAQTQPVQKAATVTPATAPTVNPNAATTVPFANVPFGSLVLPPMPPVAAAPTTAPAGTTTATTKKATKSAGARAVKPKEKDDGYKVASANTEEPKAKPAKEPKPEKVTKAEKPEKPAKAEKPAKVAEPSDSGGSKKPAVKPPDDSDKILKAAMGATENTL